MQLYFLGTASCYPTTTRGVSCTALRFDDGSVWLFDCGEGSQIQLQKVPLRPGKISKIFITHLHGDHLFGLPGLISTLSTQCAFSREGFVLEIFGPYGLRQFVRQSLSLSRTILPFQFVVHELMPLPHQEPEGSASWTVEHGAFGACHPQELQGRQIQAKENVWEILSPSEGQPWVRAGPVEHRVPTFGFVIQEAEQPGALDVEKLSALGGTRGPGCALLKQGKPLALPSGAVINPSDVIGPPLRGRKVVILGDTCNSDQLIDIARDCDALVHEATLQDSMVENALEKGHSTPNMAAAFAEAVGARMLVLTHFSQRYGTRPDSKKGEVGTEILGQEARTRLGDNSSCTVVLAEDLLDVSIPRHPL